MTAPSDGRSRPEIVRSVVVLPAPLEPMSATSSPVATVSDTPCSARMLPYQTWTSVSSSTARLPEVCGDDARVAAHRRRIALRDEAP